MPKINLQSSFQTRLKDFSNLITKDIKRASVQDLKQLKVVLELGIKALNQEVEDLSIITTTTNKYNNVISSNHRYTSPLPITEKLSGPIAASADPLGNNFATDAVISLYDAEEEARRQNEAYLQTNGEVVDEVEKLNELFSSIKDEPT